MRAMTSGWRMPVTLPALALAVAAAGCGPGEAPGDEAGADAAAATTPGAARTEAQLDVDWEIFRETVTGAYEQGWDTLPIGDVMVRIGRTFVGTPYAPHTLEIPGEERLVLNFEALDCVTYVENVLALSNFVLQAPPAVLQEEHVYKAFYQGILRRIRYRGGDLSGYPSRLHYFSEWIRDGEAKGVVLDVTGELGGVVDPEPVDFMSTHPDAYAQLSETGTLDSIRALEERLSATDRRFVPQEAIAAAAAGIRDGDVIAATSTVEGLDVAHTGIALWIEGELHLMHAPLVGEAVQISERTLADRIMAIGSQDGVMVARPAEPGEGG